jgi:Serine-threonine protein kinase 19
MAYVRPDENWTIGLLSLFDARLISDSWPSSLYCSLPSQRMPLYLTGSHSSRVRKPTAVSYLKRSSSSSLFANLARTKAPQRGRRLADDDGEDAAEGGAARLDATGKIVPSTSISNAKSVEDAIKQSIDSMFCEMPERAGMNSVRIAEVLNFRKRLPPVVTAAHVHALVIASSRTEREISALVSGGKLRKVKLLGRGNDLSGLSELLILTSGLEGMLRGSGLADSIVDAFLDVLAHNPRAASLPARSLQSSHASVLIKEGYLVSPSLAGSSRGSLSGASIVAPPVIARAASGSCLAVGGEALFENLGGVGVPQRHESESQASSTGSELAISVPNIGPYLRLLYAARSHLLDLLGKLKYREAPLYLLRERWDGSVESDSRVSVAKRARGEFAGLLPGKTKKWKDLYGLDFDWALQECLGGGLVELFETKSVGHGIRAL